MSRDLNSGTADAADDERARLELARASRLATIRQAIAVVAHEIKQPLAAIVTNGNAALRWLGRETPDIAEAQLALERIIADGHRASEIIQNIRAMLETKPPEAGPVDLNGAVRDAVALLAGELKAHQVKVEIDLASALPPVPIDRTQLQQVVLNLVSNAIEAMEPVTDRARVVRIVSKIHDGEVTLAVEDCGTGIDADNLSRIFIPFFTTKPRALGLGLTICRSIVEARGGRVYADAATPHGAVFYVVLTAGQVDSG